MLMQEKKEVKVEEPKGCGCGKQQPQTPVQRPLPKINRKLFL